MTQCYHVCSAIKIVQSKSKGKIFIFLPSLSQRHASEVTCLIKAMVATKSMPSYTLSKTCLSSFSKEGHIFMLHFVLMNIFAIESANMIDIGTRLIMAAGNEKIAR